MPEADKKSGAAVRPTPATLYVNLPANATLTVDGHRSAQTATTRKFVSPPLEPGQVYAYTLRAEVEIDGKVSVITRDVTVEAGRESRVTLALPVGVASK